MQRQTTNAMSIRQLILVGAINVMTCSSLLISAIIFLLLGRSVGFFYLAGGLLFGTLAIVYYRCLIDRVESVSAKAAASS